MKAKGTTKSSETSRANLRGCAPDEESHDKGRVITCFRDVVYYSDAVAINQSFLQAR